MSAGTSGGITFAIRPSPDPVPAGRRAELLADPGFGRIFTDHMITVDWDESRGWHDAQLRPYGPFSMDPASAVLHYAQEIFEGLKAYRQVSGAVVMFRPGANAARFNRSAARMSMPGLPEDAFIHALELLVTQDRDWVPAAFAHGGVESLYLRPFMFASQVGLGISRPSASYTFAVIASAAGTYFSRGGDPVSVWLADTHTRAAPGGTGAAKTGGNYAGAFAGQLEAVAHGCQQVVWLDAIEHQWVEEMGGMNLFFVRGSGSQARIMTPPLTGTLLPGVTRDSLLTLAPDLGIPAEEAAITVAEWRAGCESGDITESFACGTAAVITPVGAVRGAAGGWAIGDGKPGAVTMHLREQLLGIQFGQLPDPYGWVHKVC
ncbi:MAG TPA: branched-chain amino acid aminotransferase [Streptosporangiaceae bacterium]|nr:branched-chain amino acid aminotransferase [Streptosporangiaceae bacterium]